MLIPTNYKEFRQNWQLQKEALIHQYANNEVSFIPNLLPEQALQLSNIDTFKILNQRLGGNLLTLALNPDTTIKSPISHHFTTDWMKRANVVGINVRTINSFWNIIKYAFTLPETQSTIHLLPIWEVGVVASLYGMSSWNINPEFYDKELARLVPQLNTVEKQLKVVINLLHALGKTVGMDVIPHTDRYSQIVLANPQYFEWLQRKDTTIVNHSADLYIEVQKEILNCLEKLKSAISLNYPKDAHSFFNHLDEDGRLLVLFGEKEDQQGRLKRRNIFIQHLYECGLEPVPATMAPPYRGLKVNKNDDAKTIDKDGRVWRDYVITEPQEMSRVFGPLTRFKLYERKDDNQNWEIDFDQPRKEVWKYVSQHYSQIQATYNFDFMRGDMSHVQMRPGGVPSKTDIYYDILKTVKDHIQVHVPYFAYFAETFIAPAGVMAYGDEIDHLELSEADVTLGDLQSLPIDTANFSQRLRYYYDILTTRKVSPCFTILTGDKDDPRFDEFYLKGNAVRFFIACFLHEMPSYMALGFETRDRHEQPAPNEHYTKLYVFQIDEGPKATNGNYVWGQNGELFHQLNHIKLFAEDHYKNTWNDAVRWLLPPDATGFRKVIAWTQKENPTFVYVVNLATEQDCSNVKLPSFDKENVLEMVFSTIKNTNEKDKKLVFNQINYHLEELKASECRVYKLLHLDN